MKIRLMACDSKIANIAILKIAQYHINCGDDVGWYNPLFDFQDASILYISKIFTFTKEPDYLPICGNIVRGGSGYDLTTKLDPKIEKIKDIRQAYLLLYPKIDYSIIFTTRGCVNNCKFCIVPIKEGMIHSVDPTSLNPNGKYIYLLDNNFFNECNWKERLQYLKELNQPIDFNTGIDCRTITEEQAAALSTLKIKNIHIAWDNIEDENKVLEGIKKILKYIPHYKITCYILVGFKNNSIIESDVYRVKKLHTLKIRPFAMGYISNEGDHRTSIIKDFQRWVNRHLYKKLKWNEYKKR